MALQIKRGTDEQRIVTLLLEGEPYYVTDYAEVGVTPLWIGDGVTYGGVPPEFGEIGELENVLITSVANNQFLQYNSTTDQWTNRSNLAVPGNTTLGDASTDTVTINASTLALPNNLNVDSGTLFVDATNNRIGVGNTSPAYKVDITGTIRATGAIFGGDLALDGDLAVNGGDITSTSTSGTLFGTVPTVNIGSGTDTHVVVVPSVTQATNQNTGALQVKGGASFKKAVWVGGKLSIDDTTDATDVYTASLQTDGGLGVAGKARIGSSLHVAGLSNLNAGLAVTGTSTFSDNATFSNNITVNDDALIKGDLTVDGSMEVKGTLTYINTTQMIVEDPVITIGNGDSSQSTMDMGVRFNAGTATGFFGWDRSQDKFAFYKSLTGDNTLSGTLGNALFGNVYADNITTDDALIGEVLIGYVRPLAPGDTSNPRTIRTSAGDLILSGFDNGSNDIANWNNVVVEAPSLDISNNAVIRDSLTVNNNSTLGVNNADATSVRGQFKVHALADNDLFVSRVTGRTGFGTNNPAYKVDVVGDIGLTGKIRSTVGTSDYWEITGGGTTDAGYLEIKTGDNGVEPIYVRQYNGASVANEITLLDASGKTVIDTLSTVNDIETEGSLFLKGNGDTKRVALTVDTTPWDAVIQWNTTTSRWEHGTSVSAVALPNQVLDTTSNVSFSSVTIDSNVKIDSLSVTTNSSGILTSIDTFPTSTYRSAKYTLQATSGSAYQVMDVMIIHDGTNAYISVSNEIKTGAELTEVGADIVAGNVRLLVTPVNSTTVYKLASTKVAV